MKHFFVTGSTGVVGSAVIRALMQDPEVRATLLIRAKDASELAARLDELCQFCELDPNARYRLEAVQGDASLERFGMEKASYANMASSCTHIIHSAGAVRMNLPIDKARASAVGSARAVLQLIRDCEAASGQRPKTELVSTVGVGGRLPGTLPERWIREPREFHNTYEQAKAEAEALVDAEGCRDLRITIHRPSMVVGDSRTGRNVHFQVFYHLAEFLSGRKTSGIHPGLGRCRLDVVPSDYVAQAIVWSAGQPPMAGEILHLCSGPEGSVSLIDLQRVSRERFGAWGLKLPPLVRIPIGLLRGLLPIMQFFASEKGKRALGTLPVFLDYLESDQGFGNPESTRTLEAAGIRRPAASEYLGVVLDAYLAAKYPRRAQV